MALNRHEPTADPEQMSNRTLRSIAAVLAASTILAACSTSTPDSLAFADEAPVVDAPIDGEVSPAEQAMITFYADWLCELERRTFTSLDESEMLLAESLRSAGLERATYDRFILDTLPLPHVREAVLFEHLELCLPT